MSLMKTLRTKTCATLIATALAVFAFSSTATAAPPVSTVIPRVAGGPAALLGTGYDSRDRAFREQCVTGDVLYEGVATSKLDLEHAVKQEDIASQYGFGLAGGFDWGFAEAMVGVRIALLNVDSSLTKSFVYTNDIRGKIAYLTNLRLTSVGRRARDTHDPEYIRLVCGDEFVAWMPLGATLFLNARLEFRDSLARYDFEQSVTLRFLMFKETVAFQQHTEDIRESTKITVDGVQLGGDPSKLDDVLSRVRTRTCTLRTADACDDVVTRLVAYASESSGLQGQLEGLEYRGSRSSAREYRTARYDAFTDDADVRALGSAKSMTREAEVALTSLGDRLGASLRQRARARTLLGGHLRPTQRAELERFTEGARQNVLSLSNAIDACYVAPASCPLGANAALAGLVPLREERLVVPVTTYDVCLRAASSTADARTIRALAEATGTSLPAHTPAGCEGLETRLDAAGSLDLAGRALTDVTALRGIVNLKSLSLRDNSIANLDSVGDLDGLEILDVTGNKLQNVFPLARLGALRELSAGYNAITSVWGMENATALRFAAFHGNPVASFEPLEPLVRAGLTLVRTVADRCELERTRVVSLGLASRDEVDDLRGLDFAPLYAKPREPSSGIEGWMLCDAAARTY